MKKDTKKILLIIAIFIILPLTILVSMIFLEKKSIEFSLKGDDTITLEVENEYKEDGYIAKSRRRDLQKVVQIKNDLDTKKVGTYKIEYNLYVRILGIKKTLTRTVKVVDSELPTLNITSSKNIDYVIGDKFKYPTYEAQDNYDGDITDKVKVDDSNLNLKKVGTYKINYLVVDSSGNKAEDSVIVNVNKRIEALIDISISKQKLTYYENNSVVLVSDIVTGNPTLNRDTPIGNFQVVNKARNVTLKGADYTCQVSYWIAFKGHSYGMHDASWRKTGYGGEIYKTDGSRGCVNMPLAKVRELYEKVEVGTPVYIHE